jgi:cytochrome c oxidase subunit II
MMIVGWFRRDRPGLPILARARQGRRYFMEDGCAACHTIAGTAAEGTPGPNLTHLAGRETLAADTIPNTPEAFAASYLSYDHPT